LTAVPVGKICSVLALFLVPLLPIAGLLFLLGAERLEDGLRKSEYEGFARSQSALAEAVDRARREAG
jgi:hypothetical protein